ncbi:sensor histidine kinase [Aurantivibrio infirmus]
MNSLHSTGKAPSHKISTDLRIFLWVLASAIPMLVLLLFIVFDGRLSTAMKILIAGISIAWVFIVASIVREKVIHHIRTLSNLIEAIRAEDYSLKSSRTREPGELAELYQQINALNDKLKESRQSEMELQNLLEKVVNQINVAIIACDANDCISLVNELASKLLKRKAEFLLGVELADTSLAALPLDKDSQLLDHSFPGADGRWQITQQYYRQHGKPGRIIFITDLKQVLSEEETSAWQRLIRVIGHEVNNSLTPITSICQTVDTLIQRPPEDRNEDDIREGLAVIAERAKGLKEFISVYSRIARLPEPQKVIFSVATLINKIRGMYKDDRVRFPENIPATELFGDPVHIEQILINLIKNGIEANHDGEEPLQVSIELNDEHCEFIILDSGKGISNPANLFVPFYTTKPQGAGIGLTLCRQIAAKHNGQVTLENRDDKKGAVAKLKLPLPLAH